MQTNEKDAQDFDPQGLNYILETLRAREEEVVLMIDVCFHQKNKAFRANYEAICAFHQQAQTQEQHRYTKEEHIINRCLNQSMGGEAERK